MKQLILTFISIFLIVSIQAQTDKGTWAVAGKSDLNFLFANSKNFTDSARSGDSKVTRYGITTGVGYFVIDNLSVGIAAQWSYDYHRTGASPDLGMSRTKMLTRSLSLLPQVQYYFPVNDQLRPFIVAGVGYSWMEQQDTRWSSDNLVYRLSGLAASGGAGLAYFISESFSIEMGLQFNYLKLNNRLDTRQLLKENQLAGNIGFSLFF